jgi:GT2 family glycosyltransferase
VTVSPTLTPINFYMTEEAILNPPVDINGPQAIVTANAAVCAAAFQAVGGFDVSYPFAAGEDLDLGLKLRRLGTIGWANDAIVRHQFIESGDDFRNRFLRYGAGTAHLAHRLHLPCLRPTILLAKSADLQVLADIHIAAMQTGYDRHRNKLAESTHHYRIAALRCTGA